MRKIITALALVIILSASTALAAPEQGFEKGSLNFEFGSTLNSKVSGKGHLTAEVKGESGFKTMVTAGLNKNWALQYKYGLFKSEQSTILGITTYAQAKLQDFNLLYKVNPNITLIAGYEHTVISYGLAVSEASKSTAHFGIKATKPLNQRATLFANIIAGNDVSLQEAGISYKLSKAGNFNIAYVKRKINDVDLIVPARSITGKENYTMTGITMMFDYKL